MRELNIAFNTYSLLIGQGTFLWIRFRFFKIHLNDSVTKYTFKIFEDPEGFFSRCFLILRKEII